LGVIARYREHLPIGPSTPEVDLNEGSTPLVPSHNIGRALGMKNLYFKYEGLNPTGSFKDRGMVVAVAKALEAKFGEPRKAALTWKPHNTVPVNDETGEKLLKLIDLLNEHDDVQNVFANFEVSDALVAKMGG